MFPSRSVLIRLFLQTLRRLDILTEFLCCKYTYRQNSPPCFLSALLAEVRIPELNLSNRSDDNNSLSYQLSLPEVRCNIRLQLHSNCLSLLQPIRNCVCDLIRNYDPFRVTLPLHPMNMSAAAGSVRLYC